MRTPTPQQKAVLESGARVRVVRASPGSGKTTLVGILIREELKGWNAGQGAIAAVSFTRVGGQEIRRELGHDLGHPHFVGTIDAFLFRYIVRPFLKKVNPTWATPRLIPADWTPKCWGRGPDGNKWVHRGSGGASANNYNLFETCFTGEDTSGPILAYPPPRSGGIEMVPENDRAALLQAKEQSWKRYGWLTHSDAAFLASQLLSDATYGQSIRTVILSRFPLLIVDELQDTGYFLGKSIRLLLDEKQARGVLVGDPNQAIYEFNGARPDLFEWFERILGAQSLPLGDSQRCLPAVVTAAKHVKQTTDAFEPNTSAQGRAFLVPYADMASDVRKLVASIRSKKPLAELKVVARKSKTVEDLSAHHANEAKSLHSPALHHVYRSVKTFRQGQNVRGFTSLRAALELSVFGYEGATEETIAQHGIDPREWKALTIRCLLRCNALATTVNLYDWQLAAGVILDQELSVLELPAALSFEAGKLKPQQRNEWNKQAGEFLPIGRAVHTAAQFAPIQTVHAVKGETHDVTIFVVPDSAQPARCPSTIWWSDEPKHLEERRIAYVAMTRTRGDLVMCVSDRCYKRLCEARSTFVGSFMCQSVDECIAAF